MDKFISEEILQDMNIKAPASILQVKYGDISVTPGKVLTPTQVKNQPILNWAADPNSFYAVLFNDIDVPSREDPKFREAYHWGVVNIPGKNIDAGEVLTEFIGSGPGQGTKLHRYVFLVFKQSSGKQQFNEKHISNRAMEGRASHSIAKFAAAHGLGDPVAGTFYLAEWDDYVPKLHEQLSG